MNKQGFIGTLVVVLSGVLAGPLPAQQSYGGGAGNQPAFRPFPARPHGIYAKVDISAEILTHPNKTAQQLNDYFNSIYWQMLQNTAVSGLAIQAHWDTLNPNPPDSANPYNWKYLDDAFVLVRIFNEQNPNTPRKTIQLIVTPGLQSPTWLLSGLLTPCDALFVGGAPPSNCGTANFAGFGPEEADGTVLPLPWNPVYKNTWRGFLIALNERYGTDPALVSIAVAGPTAASEEMILPNDSNTPAQIYGIPPATTSVSANNMWLQLLAFHYRNMPEFQNSDRAFIDEWDAAIDMYAQIFHGLTLVATTGSGLPRLNATNFTIPPDFIQDCGAPNMDCAAETTILSYFVDPFVGGFNAKATQTSGMEASRASNVDLGVSGVKLVSQATQYFNWPSAQILGGAQFNTSVANSPVKEGGNDQFPSPSVEQGLYDVLQVFFSGTPVAEQYCQGGGGAPLNYLQVYFPDFQYADGNGATSVTQGACDTVVNVSAQMEFESASQNLLEIAER